MDCTSETATYIHNIKLFVWKYLSFPYSSFLTKSFNGTCTKTSLFWILSWTISDKSHIVFSFFDKKFWTNCSCSCKAAILNFIHYRTGEGAWCKHQKIEQHEKPDKKLKKWNSKSIFRSPRKCTNSIFWHFFLHWDNKKTKIECRISFFNSWKKQKQKPRSFSPWKTIGP